MSDPNELLLSAFDGHSVDGVRAALAAGADVRTPIRGKAPIYWLLEEYTRSDGLHACIRMLLDAGAELELSDARMLPAILAPAAPVLQEAIAGRPTLLDVFRWRT